MDVLPKNVQEQKDAANKLFDDLEKGAGTPGTPAPPAETPPIATAEAPKPDEGTPATPAPASTEDVEALKQQISSLTQALTEVQAALADENRDTWKQKYLVVDGKHKAETAPALKRVHELEVEIARLKTEVEAAKASKPDVPKADAPLDETDLAIMNKMGIDEETYRLMDKKWSIKERQTAPQEPAKEPAKAVEPEPPAAPAQPKIDPARTAYLTLLDQNIPDWHNTMKMPEFVQFLNKMKESVGGVEGRTLREILIQADAENNAALVTRVYQAFYKLSAPAPAGSPERPSREAAPTSSKSGSGDPVTPETWNMEKIIKFESDIATGKIKIGSAEHTAGRKAIDEHLAGAKIVG